MFESSDQVNNTNNINNSSEFFDISIFNNDNKKVEKWSWWSLNLSKELIMTAYFVKVFL